MRDIRYNENNEIVKYDFFEELRHTKNGKDNETIRQFINAIHEFEVVNNFEDFKKYNKDWAIEFKHHLNNKKNRNTGEAISKSYYFNTLSFVRFFFKWLVEERKEYKKIKKKDIEFLNATKKDAQKAKAKNFQESYDISDILSTIRKMPQKTEIERRNKALISLALLTTPRIAALQKARIGSIRYMNDYEAWMFLQDPRKKNDKVCFY